MIQEYYGLHSDPFSLSPDLEFLFVSNAHEETLAHLAYGLEQNEDITLIVGDIGTGKTLALHRLLTQLSKGFIPVYISVTQLDFEQLLKLIMMKLEMGVSENDGLGALLHHFERSLISYREKNKKVLLVIDEAQNLTLEGLESIRMLLNLGQPGPPILQLILAGQLNLRDSLNSPEMRQLKQRIRVEYELGHLSRSEIKEYLVHRLAVAGREQPLFSKSAIDKIYKFSRGVPRLVNHIVTKAMLNGYVAEAGMISAKHIEPLDDSLIGSSQVSTSTEDVFSGRPPEITPSRAKEPHGNGKSRLFWGIFSVLALLVLGWFVRDNWQPVFNGLAPRMQEQSASGFEKGRIKPTESLAPEEEKPGADDFAKESTLLNSPPGIDEVVETGIQQANSINDEATLGDVLPTGQSIEAESGPLSGVGIAVDNERPDTETRAVRFMVHVASFKDEERAGVFQQHSRGMSIPVQVRQATTRVGDTWFRVYFGPFDSLAQANDECLRLKEKGIIDYYAISEESVLPGDRTEVTTTNRTDGL